MVRLIFLEHGQRFVLSVVRIIQAKNPMPKAILPRRYKQDVHTGTYMFFGQGKQLQKLQL